MNINIRRVYLYLTSLIGLVLVLIGGVQMVNIGLKTWIFTKADNYNYGVCDLTVVEQRDKETMPPQLGQNDCEHRQSEQRSAQRQSEAARSIAFVLVGAPVWLYHWSKVKKEKDNQTNNE